MERIEPDKLVGIWKLDNLYVEDGGASREYPFGEGVMGQLIITASGIFSAHVYGNVRERHLDKYQTYDTAIEARDILEKSVSYYGHYQFHDSDNKLTLGVEGSLDPAWQGGDQERVVSLEDGRLKLSTFPIEWDGHVIVTHLEWMRCEA